MKSEFQSESISLHESENQIEYNIISNSQIKIEKSPLTTDKIMLGVCGHVSRR